MMKPGEVYGVEGDEMGWLVMGVHRGEQVETVQVFGFAKGDFRDQTWWSYNGSEWYLRTCQDELTRAFVPIKLCEVPL